MPETDKKSAVKRASGCLGKTIYFDITFARRVAKAIWRDHRDAVAPYRCVRCDGFHLGTSTAKFRKTMKDR